MSPARDPPLSRKVGIGAVIAAVAGSIVLIAVVQQPPNPPPGSPMPSPTTEPTPHATTLAPSPSSEAGFFDLGDVGHFSYGEGPDGFELWLVNLETNEAVQASTPAGPVLAAALSPNAEWVAYITRKGETGANEVWALRLADGAAFSLGCSAALPFTDRLTWSPDGLLLAYTLAVVDLGGGVGCAPITGPEFATDVWMLNIDSSGVATRKYTESGDAFAASFLPYLSVEGGSALWISHAAEQPWSELVEVNGLNAGGTMAREDGVFLPLVNPRQRLALFWRPTLDLAELDQGWTFEAGSIPLLGSDTWDGDLEPFSGTPILADGSFSDGDLAWSSGGDTYAFWSSGWEQEASLLYAVGRASSPVVGADIRSEALEPFGGWIEDIAISGDGAVVAVHIGIPSAGVNDPPRSYIIHRTLADKSGILFGSGDGGGWNGPAVFVPDEPLYSGP